jgi:hypothetical protein
LLVLPILARFPSSDWQAKFDKYLQGSPVLVLRRVRTAIDLESLSGRIPDGHPG